MLVTPSLGQCSNKYKLAREGINKDKYIFFGGGGGGGGGFRMKSSSVERDEFSVVA